MQIISLRGSSVATLNSANNIGQASYVQVTNTHTADVTLTVATVGTPSMSFPGTIVLTPDQTILLRKAPTDTLSGGSAGHLVATAIQIEK